MTLMVTINGYEFNVINCHISDKYIHSPLISTRGFRLTFNAKEIVMNPLLNDNFFTFNKQERVTISTSSTDIPNYYYHYELSDVRVKIEIILPNMEYEVTISGVLI